AVFVLVKIEQTTHQTLALREHVAPRFGWGSVSIASAPNTRLLGVCSGAATHFSGFRCGFAALETATPRQRGCRGVAGFAVFCHDLVLLQHGVALLAGVLFDRLPDARLQETQGDGRYALSLHDALPIYAVFVLVKIEQTTHQTLALREHVAP